MLRKMLRNNKGQTGAFAMLGAMAVGIATLAITLTVAFLIMAQGREQAIGLDCTDPANMSTCGDSVAAISTMQEATADIPGWVPLVVIASIGAVLLGLVAMFRRAG